MSGTASTFRSRSDWSHEMDEVARSIEISKSGHSLVLIMSFISSLGSSFGRHYLRHSLYPESEVCSVEQTF